MGAKLIKTGVNYLLEDDKGVVITSTSINKEGLSLSLKNCQVVERGYDLDELAELSLRRIDGEPVNDFFQQIFKLGFRKALEILGDKKFSEEDIVNAFEAGRHRGHDNVNYLDTGSKTCSEYLSSLQQNEWEVEIEMEWVKSSSALGNPHQIPKLDSDGCLILKLR
jgi:hypothetical protein